MIVRYARLWRARVDTDRLLKKHARGVRTAGAPAPVMSSVLFVWRKRNELRLARFDPAIRPRGYDVVSESTVGVQPFLRDFHFVPEKGHGDFALGCVTGNKRRDVAFNRGFANSFTNVWVTAAGHPFTIELHLQFVVTESEDPKVVPVVLVETVDFSSGDGAQIWFGAGSWFLRSSERGSRQSDYEWAKKSVHA